MYLLRAANAAGLVWSCPRDVNRTVMTSHIGFSSLAQAVCPGYGYSGYTWPPHSSRSSGPRATYSAWGCGHAARDTATSHVGSTRGPLAPRSSRAYGAATAWPSPSLWSARAAAVLGVDWCELSKNCSTSGRAPAAAATPRRPVAYPPFQVYHILCCRMSAYGSPGWFPSRPTAQAQPGSGGRVRLRWRQD